MADAEDPDAAVTQCWACGVLVDLLKDMDGAIAFKCGWCGAITDPATTQHRNSSTSEQVQAAASKRLLQCLASVVNWMMVVVVFLIIAVIMVLGIVVVQPRVLGSNVLAWMVHAGFTTVLTFSVLYNYVASVFGSAGSVQQCVQMPARSGPGATYPQGAFNDWRYCVPCRGPKPPGTHHCRVCKQCVVDMDHHCPFIKNCVGRANMRPFISFLTWVVFSALYIIGMCSVLVYRHRSSIRRMAAHARLQAAASSTISNPGTMSGGLQTLLVAFAAISSAPWWMLVTYYLLLVGLALLVCMSLLLGSQLRLLGQGVNYIDQLKLQQEWQQQQGVDHKEAGNQASEQLHSADDAVAMPGTFSFRRLKQQLAEVFETDNVAWWLVPRWQPLLGTAPSNKKVA